MMDFKTSSGPIVRLSSGSLTMSLKDSKRMLQTENSSSVTTPHQTNGPMWSLDLIQQMKHQGG